MTEFGHVIPWLDGADGLQYATNGTYFRDQLLRSTGQEDGMITAYQFVDGSDARMFIGGILHFEQIPERFVDHRNIEIAERLTTEGHSFVSCLQVRHPHRGANIGRTMMARALAAMRVEKGRVWGVVSDPRTLEWHRSFGAHTPSPSENKDKLWIVHWD